MGRLEELTSGASVKGILPHCLVTVVEVKWYGSAGVELTFRDAVGHLDRVLLYRDREQGLEIVPPGHSWSFTADGEILQLVSEAYRVRLASGADASPSASLIPAGAPSHNGNGTPERSSSLFEEGRTEGELHDSIHFAAATLSYQLAEEQLVLEEKRLAHAVVQPGHQGDGEGDLVSPRQAEAFFLKAVRFFGAQVSEPEPGYYEITQFPASLSGLDGAFKPELTRDKRIAFDPEKLSASGKPLAEMVDPGHPLMKAVVDLVLDSRRDALRQGAVLVDPGDSGEEMRVLFYLEHAVEEIRAAETGGGHVLSRQVQFVELNARGEVAMVDGTPYLDYRPLTEDEHSLVAPLREEGWIRDGLEDQALEFAVAETVPRHFQTVKRHQEELIARAATAVRDRIREDFKAREGEGEESGTNGQPESQQVAELESQLQQHVEELERKRQIFPLPPLVVGGVLVVPAGLLVRLREGHQGEPDEWAREPGRNGASGRSGDVSTESEGEPRHDGENSWQGIIDQLQQKDLQKEEPREERPLREEERYHQDNTALFSGVPGLVQSHQPELMPRVRQQGESLRSGAAGRRRIAGVPLDLQGEWEAHAARLQEEVPGNIPLVIRNEVDKGIAVWIPPGKFPMGSKIGNKDEKPVHIVQVDGFYMDLYPVTNVQFAKFVQATGALDWESPAGYADHPVVSVTWENARAYCEWAGKRLPAEAEWEKAARGVDGRNYPWGDEFDTVNGNGLRTGYAGTSPVGNFPSGKSPYGILDMAGNVWEWVSDWYDATYYAWSRGSNPKGPDSGEHRVLRGGAWICHANYLRSTKRDHQPPDYQSNFIGFRCVS